MIHAAAPTTFKDDDKSRPSSKIALWSSKQGSSGECIHICSHVVAAGELDVPVTFALHRKPPSVKFIG